jgi:hypothetical protein
MNIVYTDHAKERMIQRGVSQKYIRSAIKNPDVELIRKDGVTTLHYYIEERVLEIICEKSHTVCVIITCYFL